MKDLPRALMHRGLKSSVHSSTVPHAGTVEELSLRWVRLMSAGFRISIPVFQSYQKSNIQKTSQNRKSFKGKPLVRSQESIRE